MDDDVGDRFDDIDDRRGAFDDRRGAFDDRLDDGLADRRDRGALDREVDEELESAHDLWGRLQWQDPSDFLPVDLLTEFSDRAGQMQAVAGRAHDDGVWERRENPDRSRPRRRRRQTSGDRNPPPRERVATATRADGVPAADGDVAAVPGDSRFSLNNIRTSSLLIAATTLVLLGAAANWASNSDDDWSPPSAGRKVAASPYPSAVASRPPALSAEGSAGRGGQQGTPSPTKRDPAGASPVRKITIAPASVCRRFVETSAHVDTVTVSVQNACQ